MTTSDTLKSKMWTISKATGTGYTMTDNVDRTYGRDYASTVLIVQGGTEREHISDEMISYILMMPIRMITKEKKEMIVVYRWNETVTRNILERMSSHDAAVYVRGLHFLALGQETVTAILKYGDLDVICVMKGKIPTTCDGLRMRTRVFRCLFEISPTGGTLYEITKLAWLAGFELPITLDKVATAMLRYDTSLLSMPLIFIEYFAELYTG